MSLPNAIIAGTNKAGTTSLFRYLADHPDVCASKVKEILFFSRLTGEPGPDDLSRYASYFDHCGSDERIRLEASPNYLAGGRAVARQIDAAIPGVKLILLLREPAGRLLSAYRRKSQRNDPGVAGIGAGAYVDDLIERGEQIVQVRSVCYAPLIKEYLEVFPADRILVSFFDDLRRDSRECTRRVCRFLGIEEGFFDDYEFRIENKTRVYKSRGLQKIAHRLNMALEPVLNNVPALRNSLRDVYNRINEAKTSAPDESAEHAARLARYFYDRNAELGALLTEAYPGIELPAWARPAAASGDPDKAGN